MARIRTVKPEFFRHEGLYESEIAFDLPLRVAFAGLWTSADREGRFKWNPRQLKLDCLPYDEVDFEDVLRALAERGFIQKYEVEGAMYGCVPSWKSHQCINQRESQSLIPAPDPTQKPLFDVHVHARALHSSVSASVNVPQELRETILGRDGACVRCKSTDNLSIDHIFPQSIGGTHAITNLRTLCRSCNSARPVSGKPLIDDLLLDGLTLDDMPRMCMHVHARVERKGKEGERKGKGTEGKTDSLDASLSSALTNAVFNAYARAYDRRYGVMPKRNAKVNGQLSQLVKRLGSEEAPEVAAYYLHHNNGYYVGRGHSVDCLLADAEKLRTEWATNRTTTQTQARMTDETQTRLNVWGPIIEEARRKKESENG